ncbi:putative protein kinase RLK-Pelle-L-LEC family [Medicago truncatula]|uniref:Protein kinase domain-containing protein n=1 Tax=Medicago truncatula TaxID=3880 RepID=A0A396JL02_MEDTR|nr:putative protein kinase RLK-Pelle-L-LEC family [Medicago truncatula]
MLNSPSSCSSNIINQSKNILVLFSLLLVLSYLPKTNSLLFNITNFDDPTVASNMSYQGDGKSTNGSIDLNKVCLSTESNVIHSWEFSSNLEDSNSTTSLVEGNDGKGSLKTVIVVVAVIVPVILVFLIASIVGWVIVKRKRKNCDEGLDEYGIPFPKKFDLDKATIPRRFEYSELVAATNGFDDDRMLGRGGYGQVYKGALSYLGKIVAVKRIFADFENSERVFINEVRIISRLIHRNLVQFIGWCHEQDELLLVFEYMPNGSLDTHLFGDKKSLAWEVRYKVALGVANALRYLHDDAEQCVLHRDIKSANVLLDTDFSTKLGDFGMAKLVDPMLRTQRTDVVGTYGYLAPEYINGGRASKESDMYSFGIVALELATGRRFFQDGDFHVPLMNWVWGLYVEGNLMCAADEKLNMEFDVSEMKSLLIVGLWCTHSNDKERPKAYEVIKVLQLEMALPELPLDMHDRAPPIVPFRQSNGPSMAPPMTNSLITSGR